MGPAAGARQGRVRPAHGCCARGCKCAALCGWAVRPGVVLMLSCLSLLLPPSQTPYARLSHPLSPPTHYYQIQGIVIFLFFYVLTSVGLLVKMQGEVATFLPTKWYTFLLADAANHGLSFVLFWTMGYTLIHIY